SRKPLRLVAIFIFPSQNNQKPFIAKFFGDANWDATIGTKGAINEGAPINFYGWHDNRHGGRSPDPAHQIRHGGGIFPAPPHGFTGKNIESTNPKSSRIITKRSPVELQRHTLVACAFINIFSME